MKRYFILFCLFAVFSAASVNAQTFSGTTAGQFLKIETGAKSIAMGGAFTSIVSDATALYWNPGGISKLPNSSASFTYTQWLAETTHSYAAVVLKIGADQAIGISYTSLTMPDMLVRTELDQNGTGEYFSASDYALGVTYGLNVTEDFSIGFTGKYVGQSIWHMSASTIAFDIGVHYITPLEGLQIGMSISNIGTKLMFEGKDNFIYYAYDPTKNGNSDKIFADIKMDSWDLPILFRFGVSYKLLDTETHGVTLSVDANHPNDYNESINAGFEYSFDQRLFLRAGYKSLFKEESEEGLTAGIGLLYYMANTIPVRVDYAFADFGRLNSIHRFTLEIGF